MELGSTASASAHIAADAAPARTIRIFEFILLGLFRAGSVSRFDMECRAAVPAIWACAPGTLGILVPQHDSDEAHAQASGPVFRAQGNLRG
jgi:hypothetical protein